MQISILTRLFAETANHINNQCFNTADRMTKKDTWCGPYEQYKISVIYPPSKNHGRKLKGTG